MGEIEEFFKKAENKLNSSKILFDAKDYSNSLSLFYYSMLLVSKALLLKVGISTNKHYGIIREFGRLYVHENVFDSDIYKYLTTTQSLRNQSDYEATDDITEQIARTKIIEAEKYIQEAKKFI